MLDRRRVAERLVDRLAHRHPRAAPERVVGGDHDLRAESCSRCTIAGAAKPEKIGTCTAPMCAQACEATAASGRHRHVDRDAVARLDADAPQRLGEPDHLARELGERPLAPGAVLAAEDRRRRVGRPLGPDVDAGAGDVQPAPFEPRRPLDPARVVEHAVPRSRELELEILRDRAPEALGLVDRDPVERVVVVAAEPGQAG